MLSEKHLEKLNAIENPYKKRQKYNRYFHRDSIKEVRALKKRFQAQEDRLDNLLAKKEKAIERAEQKITKSAEDKLYRKVYYPWAKREAKRHIKWMHDHGFSASSRFTAMLETYLLNYFLDATHDDEKLAALKAKMPDMELPGPLAGRVKDFNVINDDPFSKMKEVPLPDLTSKFRNLESIQQRSSAVSSQVKKASALANDLPGEAEALATDHMSSVGQVGAAQAELTKVEQLKSQHLAQIENVNDSTYLRDQAKKKAEEMAMDYLEQNADMLKAVDKQKMLLMKKFSLVPNSTDLSTAVKHISLKGRSFKERLYLAGNFQLLTLEPVSIDFSPLVGYRINKKFVAGIGANYRQTFGDSAALLAPQVLGYKAFTSYDVVRNFFVYGEFDRNTSGVQYASDIASLTWRNAAFLGAGRKLTLHKRAEMTVIFMYNFLYKHPDPVYPRKWMISLRFQTSDVAFLKPEK